MLCEEEEKGKNQSARYYPSTNEPELEFGTIKVRIVKSKTIMDSIIKRTIEIVDSDHPEPVIVKHLQEINWPDNASPDSSSMYGNVNYFVKKSLQDRAKNSEGSIVLHCSAGCGRTGTLIALVILVESIKFQMTHRADLLTADLYPDKSYLDSGVVQERISIFGAVRRMREQRWNLVKTAGQYKYIYTFMQRWVSEEYKP